MKHRRLGKSAACPTLNLVGVPSSGIATQDNVGAEHVLSESRAQRREKAVWQRRFWEHTIRDKKDGPYSSFHRCVKLGWNTTEGVTSERESIADPALLNSECGTGVAWLNVGHAPLCPTYTD